MAPPTPRPNMKKFGSPLYASTWADHRTLIVAGGGGKKSSGIPNRREGENPKPHTSHRES